MRRILFDPVRIYGVMAILGDVMIISSGGLFFNPVRVLAAGLGLVFNFAAIFYGTNKVIRISGRDYPFFQIMMGVFVLCGFIYVVSGSNLFGFEDAPRYSEMGIGVLVMAGSMLSILQKPGLSALVFSVPPLFHFVQAWEVWATQSRFDIFQIGAGVCFLLCAVLIRFFKAPQTVLPVE
ncbi:MAG: hypothetical protein H6857_05880 [Rhodospirillales bacterium]|nr:hypothetical protein [Rhodospirillales bacterium]MCB9973481.1 hypothetical protein [Rhodospirillales bacterium]MCB9980207.1 hypothetical protein [Rhodospirillales bacterium]